MVLVSRVLPAVLGCSTALLAELLAGVRVLRSREPGTGRERACGDGTLWIVETEPE